MFAAVSQGALLQQINHAPEITQASEHPIWDARRARIREDAVPYLSLIPIVIAGIAFAVRIAQSLPCSRPRWLRPFIETDDLSSKTKPVTKERPTCFYVLLSLILIGLSFELCSCLYPSVYLGASVMVIPWVFGVILLGTTRFMGAPLSVMAIFMSTAMVHVVTFVNSGSHIQTRDLFKYVATILAVAITSLVLQMPLRDPRYVLADKSDAKYAVPTFNIRSPEDNMSAGQFMTVSWMSQLIKVGYRRQLQSEDVWSLSLQFQHRELHDRFRDLKGTIIGCLLQANGLDLLMTTGLSMIYIVSNLILPILLQQLLRSMEDPTSGKRPAIVYASLALCLRLVSTQASTFNVWYGRRCYERSRGQMITMLHEKVLSRKIISTVKSDDDPDQSASTASMGKILNLMRNDVYEVAQRFWEFYRIVTVPLRLIFSIVLVCKIIGWSCVLGIATLVVAQCVNALITRVLLRWDRARRTATDVKLQKTAQFVEAIRHLRWYGWQNQWLNDILEARHEELRLRLRTGLLTIVIDFVNILASNVFPVVVFSAYTALTHNSLTIDIAFPALALFLILDNNLRELPDLITAWFEARIALQRIEAFMAEPDIHEPFAQPLVRSHTTTVHVKTTIFAWPGQSKPILEVPDISFPIGLTVVYGTVGSGKSALLQGILGELDILSGVDFRFADKIGYCCQTPWLQSMSIKENILFSAPLNDARYSQVLKACALDIDMKDYRDADHSQIGENGIGLSGGQRARVALARALYSDAKVLLLDDPLSALDHKTAEHIVREALCGLLTVNRIVILATHRVDVCMDFLTQAVKIDQGQVHAAVSAADFGQLSKADILQAQDLIANGKPNLPKNVESVKFLEDEKMASGGVKAQVYWMYIKAGKLRYWAALVVMLMLVELLDIGNNYYLKEWGEAYKKTMNEQLSAVSTLTDWLPPPDINIRPWLLVFLAIALASSVGLLLTELVMLIIVYVAGRRMFADVMQKVSHATFRFYDVTPVGRLMNRMTSDIGTVDGNISQKFRRMAILIIMWLGAILIIASITPIFLVFAIGLSVLFVIIFLRYLPTSQSLRRLEMVSLSPLMSNFGALLNGLTTVRAYCAQGEFQARVIEVTDAFQRMDHFYWTLQAWLMYRFDILSALSTFLLTLLALFTGVTPGLTAFVLVAANQFVSSTHSLCRQYGRLQMDFVSVERVADLLELEQEDAGANMPPASWPSYNCKVAFEKVTISYAPQVPPALSNISFSIPGGSTAALLGRTGSGKSTLAMSLLATTLPSEGRILIDGIDISTVNKQCLRQRITLLAQDPVLFPGSLRKNLDPLQQHSDDECKAALDRVCADQKWTLDTEIDTGGNNLSQGQRQLIGLTRAVLRRSPLIILDEATASIDVDTASRIQHVLREEMKSSTVIVIAHRVEAVQNADFYIRLDHGSISNHGPITAMIGPDAQEEVTAAS